MLVWLKANGVTGLLKESEWPAYCEKAVRAHTQAEIDFLYSRADDTPRFLLDVGLNSGLRDGELSHCEFSDLTGNVLEVKAKPHYDWRPKQHHCRKVLIPGWLADMIRQRAAASTSTLLFPNSENKPDTPRLRRLQALTEGQTKKYSPSCTNYEKAGAPPGSAMA